MPRASPPLATITPVEPATITPATVTLVTTTSGRDHPVSLATTAPALVITFSRIWASLLPDALVQALHPLATRMVGQVVYLVPFGVLVPVGRDRVVGVTGVVVAGSIAGGGWPSTPQAETIVIRRPR